MKETDKLAERRPKEMIRERTQYAVAFGIIGLILFVTGFPWVVIGFFGVVSFFIWRTLAGVSPGGTRQIFEFYLQANDILRDDDRRWYGFEITEVIERGEKIITQMNGAPPLAHFATGALYQKIGDYKNAERHLSFVVESESADERSFLNPSAELQAYVRTLRKIERQPAASPLTSTAIRSLERLRRTKAATMLENCRDLLRESELGELARQADLLPSAEAPLENVKNKSLFGVKTSDAAPETPSTPIQDFGDADRNDAGSRKTISELLHDIYDAK